MYSIAFTFIPVLLLSLIEILIVNLMLNLKIKYVKIAFKNELTVDFPIILADEKKYLFTNFYVIGTLVTMLYIGLCFMPMPTSTDFVLYITILSWIYLITIIVIICSAVFFNKRLKTLNFLVKQKL
ncbi:hypothetical protein SCLARK_001729 [Spiroplasma clarkii]|uniref:hypothetical protein n=1 Tax=Spiroplasma clarkii TaxID=2139 RepID=UPI000B5496F3|nr:hypothetical protein [Spiroplasma clarkii]ARU92187.1 hypothetical protein SCLARK_001729 [Spiroplasma clarkii]